MRSGLRRAPAAPGRCATALPDAKENNKIGQNRTHRLGSILNLSCHSATVLTDPSAPRGSLRQMSDRQHTGIRTGGDSGRAGRIRALAPGPERARAMPHPGCQRFGRGLGPSPERTRLGDLVPGTGPPGNGAPDGHASGVRYRRERRDNVRRADRAAEHALAGGGTHPGRGRPCPGGAARRRHNADAICESGLCSDCRRAICDAPILPGAGLPSGGESCRGAGKDRTHAWHACQMVRASRSRAMQPAVAQGRPAFRPNARTNRIDDAAPSPRSARSARGMRSRLPGPCLRCPYQHAVLARAIPPGPVVLRASVNLRHGQRADETLSLECAVSTGALRIVLPA